MPHPFLLWLFACACVGSAWADDPAAGAPPASPRFGIDSAKAYAHAGLELYHLDPSYPASQARSSALDANTAIQVLAQAHAYRLVARLGAASGYPKEPFPARSGNTGKDGRITYYALGISEASLRLRLGQPETDQGIRIGWMPLQGNPEAVLYGNYLARYQPYPVFVARGAAAWDSLGSLAPRVAGALLALGRPDGLLRAEGWLVKDDRDYSWLAFLSGQAPRKIKWGLGVSGYRVFTPGENLVTPAKEPATGDTAGSVFIDDDLPGSGDTVYFTYSATLYSARASLDFASLAGSASAGRYGGVFAEAALLGWNVYPPYYPDRWSRFAWTAGTWIPTFGWLDACLAQVEWRRPGDEFLIGTLNGSWHPTPVPSGYGVNQPPDNGGPNPEFANPPEPRRRASPWRSGLLLAKRLGRHAEIQALSLTYESSAGRESQWLGRIVFRIP